MLIFVMECEYANQIVNKFIVIFFFLFFCNKKTFLKLQFTELLAVSWMVSMQNQLEFGCHKCPSTSCSEHWDTTTFLHKIAVWMKHAKK